jgi:ribonuclease P protein component
MEDFSYPKSARLRNREEFQRVMNGGRKKRIENFCTLFFLPNSLGTKRLGIIASRKVGNAVVRNLAKRKLRDVFRRLRNREDLAYDLVIICGKSLAPLPLSIIEEKILKALPAS